MRITQEKWDDEDNRRKVVGWGIDHKGDGSDQYIYFRCATSVLHLLIKSSVFKIFSLLLVYGRLRILQQVLDTDRQLDDVGLRIPPSPNSRFKLITQQPGMNGQVKAFDIPVKGTAMGYTLPINLMSLSNRSCVSSFIKGVSLQVQVLSFLRPCHTLTWAPMCINYTCI
jgi:hypothetical protein